MEIGKRLASLRIEKGLSQQALADAFSMKRGKLSSYEQGRAMPSIDVLKQYARYFEVSLLQLLDEEDETISLNQSPRVLAISVDDNGNENIELVPLKAAAGYALSYGDPEFIRTLPKFQLPFLKGGSFRAFEIQGDSMHPIPSGAVVIGQYVESLREVRQEEAYIFITMHNGLLFKRVADVNKSRIFLKSDNPAYSSFSMPLSEIQEVWKTKLYMSSQFPTPDAGLNRLEQQLQQLQHEIRSLRPAEA